MTLLQIRDALRRPTATFRPTMRVTGYSHGCLQPERLQQLQFRAQQLRQDWRPGSEPFSMDKPYARDLWGPEIDASDPFLALAEGLSGIPAQYFGRTPHLRSIQLRLDQPLDGPPSGTQLWHRDTDDVANVKIFIYLNDVDSYGGPFCFVPTTHFYGINGRFRAPEGADGRVSDETMGRLMSSLGWLSFCGPAGTLIACDTTGYHRGLQPKRERLILILQWTIHRMEPTFRIRGQA